METVYGDQSSSCAFKSAESFPRFDPSALVTVARSYDRRHRLRAPGVSGLLPLRALAPWIPAGRISAQRLDCGGHHGDPKTTESRDSESLVLAVGLCRNLLGSSRPHLPAARSTFGQ